MKYIIYFVRFLIAIIKTLLYGWVLRLIALVRLIIAILKRCCAREKLPVRLRRSTPQRCMKISDPAYKRPDPLIYDQYYLMGQGIAVSWDNPDINLYEGGVLVPSHNLKADTDYTVVARIWNNSTEAPVVGLPVHFSYLSFGVGVESHWIGQTTVDLGVKGGPNHPAFAQIVWHTPAALGHYCLQVQLIWADDVNPNNNLGQENTDVRIAASPAEFDFQLRNNTALEQVYRFETDAYAIPPQDPCSERQTPQQPAPPVRAAPGTVQIVPPKHDRTKYPLPQGWSVAFNPASPQLAAGQETNVHVTLNPPAGFKGRQAINVHAFTRRGLAGGVTLYVEGK
jgi:hypothetical protein